jgi:DNA-directed RNA polymerase subunit L
MISTSLVNASFSQVSAVAHSFKIDPEHYQRKFQKYIKDQQSEYQRINKILKEYDPDYLDEGFKKTEEEMKRKFDILEAERCYYQNVDEDPYWFDMLIESIGIHSPVILLDKGLDIMISKLNTFTELLETPVDGQLEITNGYNGMDRAYCITLYNENETMGNLIASHIRKYYVEENPQMSAVGFNRSHPLKKSVMIYINPKKDSNNDWGTIRGFVIDTCSRIVKIAKDLKIELQNNNIYKSKISKKSGKK